MGIKKIKLNNIYLSLVVLVSSVTGLVVFPQTTKAESCDDPFYYLNEIWAYRPTGCDDACSASPYGTISGSASLPETTVSYLDDLNVKALIEENKARYEYAEQQTGVPWQALAALHWREAQLDSDKSIVNGNNLGEGKNDLTDEDISSDAEDDAKMAAEKLIDLAVGVYEINAATLDKTSPADVWGNALLAYSVGNVYSDNAKSYQESTYVVNGLDQDHLNMSWLGQPYDSNSGIDSNKAGALTFLKYIDGVRDTIDCSGIVAGNIVATAKNLALDVPADQDSNNVKKTNETAKESYLSAFRTVNNRLPVGDEVTDCGRFVSVVLRSSKVDIDFPASGTDIQVRYMQDSSKYIEVTQEELKPGDILVYNVGSRDSNNYSGHIMIYTGGSNGAYTAVDASLGQRVPSVRPNSAVEWMKTQPNYSAWRLN